VPQRIGFVSSLAEWLFDIPQHFPFQFFPHLKQLAIKNSALIEVADESFENLRSHLRDLSITSNNITKFNSIALGNFNRLETLDFSKNFIESLPDNVFVNFTSLKSLNFNHNQLTVLTNSMFPSANVIEKIDFSRNHLTSIDPEIIKSLKKIKVIDFSHNACIDTKYDHNENNIKKVMEVFGEIHFRCVWRNGGWIAGFEMFKNQWRKWNKDCTHNRGCFATNSELHTMNSRSLWVSGSIWYLASQKSGSLLVYLLVLHYRRFPWRLTLLKTDSRAIFVWNRGPLEDQTPNSQQDRQKARSSRGNRLYSVWALILILDVIEIE
jgi:hypothetical protein